MRRRGVLRGMSQKRICMLKLVASPPCVFVGMKSAAHFVLSLSLGTRYSSTECCKLAPETRHTFRTCLWQNNSWRIG